MLCRTASDLYWMSRHIERVDNTARLIDYAHRVALLPAQRENKLRNEEAWLRVVDNLGLGTEFGRRYGAISEKFALQYLVFDEQNPSSIYSSLQSARESGRAQRGAISSEMYEDINASWLRMRDYDWDQLSAEGLSQFLDWLKRRAASFRGISLGTLVRDEAYEFLLLGTFIERADSTLRMLDLHFGGVRQRPPQEARTAVEYYQLSAMLQAISGFETYRKIYRDTLTPERVAELLVLRKDMPRSLAACMSAVHRSIEALSGGRPMEVSRQAGALASELRYGRMDVLLQQGTGHFLKSLTGRLYALSDAIHQQFMMSDDVLHV
ncbi:MAG: hypothetical protein BWZ07_01152 [Alphaproteobacteria bacterium ADurb.BinA280]|jgi:uncharacterized alpha-E superfamily protein|nr:alpha-E domain-containing protein [Xanthomonadales bacterium]MCC6505391.1 alpha-E domain-containing protein [Aquimonas sp.]OPZ12650.1 MAG: hypothetical protein BWZ07_01152 [Alphaproteobacteria bacterium ADurb.BinA280]